MEHRLIDGGRDGGTATWDEQRQPGELGVQFSSAVGYPRPDRLVRGEAALDADLSWRWATVEAGGETVRVAPEAGEELQVDGVPGFYSLIARRLRIAGIAPGETRKVRVLRVDDRLREKRVELRATWLGGQAWRLDGSGERTSFSVRPDGTLRSIEGVAELV